MALIITDTLMSSNTTPHTAKFHPDAAADGNGAWVVSWLPGRRLLTRNQAITALTLAESINNPRMAPHMANWAAELDLDLDDALQAVAR